MSWFLGFLSHRLWHQFFAGAQPIFKAQQGCVMDTHHGCRPQILLTRCSLVHFLWAKQSFFTLYLLPYHQLSPVKTISPWFLLRMRNLQDPQTIFKGLRMSWISVRRPMKCRWKGPLLSGPMVPMLLMQSLHGHGSQRLSHWVSKTELPIER